MKVLFVVLLVSLAIAAFWNQFPIIKSSVHAILDPSLGKLILLSPLFGIIASAAIIMFILTLVQKYTTDQPALRQIKKEQELLRQEMQKYKEHPEKLLELQKKQLEFLPRTMDITTKPTLYTAIPMILLFRWFGDVFLPIEFKFLGFINWFWTYFIFMIIFSTIFRKMLKVA